jgi:hypothetical protein
MQPAEGEGEDNENGKQEATKFKIIKMTNTDDTGLNDIDLF